MFKVQLILSSFFFCVCVCHYCSHCFCHVPNRVGDVCSALGMLSFSTRRRSSRPSAVSWNCPCPRPCWKAAKAFALPRRDRCGGFFRKRRFFRWFSPAGRSGVAACGSTKKVATWLHKIGGFFVLITSARLLTEHETHAYLGMARATVASHTSMVHGAGWNFSWYMGSQNQIDILQPKLLGKSTEVVLTVRLTVLAALPLLFRGHVKNRWRPHQ